MRLARILLLALIVFAAPAMGWAAESVCSLSTTIFCEDWETTTLPGRWIDGNPTAIITSTPAAVFSGSKGLQVNFPAGADAGWLGTFLTPSGNAGSSGTAGYDHLYARMYVKLAANWVCENSPSVSCGKLMVMYGAQSGISGPYAPYSGLGQAGVRPNGADYYYAGTVMVKPTTDREIALYQYYPEQIGTFGDEIPGSPTVTMALDTWTCVEQELQANTPGQHNGYQRLYVNDALVVEHTGMRWRDTLNLQTLMFQLSFSLAPPQPQQYYIDNIVVSTQRIGCAISGPAPPVAIAIGKYFLAATVTGTGTGTVTGTGITCGVDCIEPYDPGTVVTLTATPISGSTFSGWSGDCGGAGSCVVTMSAPRNVTATFSGPVTLTWTDTNSSPNETGTEVYRCQGTLCDPSAGILVATTGVDVTTYTDAGPPAGTLGYAVRAISPPSAFSTTRYIQ